MPADGDTEQRKSYHKGTDAKPGGSGKRENKQPDKYKEAEQPRDSQPVVPLLQRSGPRGGRSSQPGIVRTGGIGHARKDAKKPVKQPALYIGHLTRKPPPSLTQLVQVATPFSTGTGVYLARYGLVVTNEHVVRSNSTVVVEGQAQIEQLAEVVYLDTYYDLALLRPRTALKVADLPLATASIRVGEEVRAVGQYAGDSIREVTGKITATDTLQHGITYLRHTARDGDTMIGSCLLNTSGELRGMNMMNVREGTEESLALPAATLLAVLETYGKGEGRPAARCFHCQEVTFELAANPKGFCPSCGKPLVLPSLVEEVLPSGVEATIEEIIAAAGHDPRLARRGPNLWRIRQGSATIQVTYHEDSGLVTGDAYLCRLPELPAPGLFAYLLRENERLRQLTFSTYGRDIILSLLIYDRYLSLATALPRFEELFAQADAYDDVLVEGFGARWR